MHININWVLRYRNKTTLMTLIGWLVSFVYIVFGIIGFVPPLGEDQILQYAAGIVDLLLLLGIVVDPTTAGMGDSSKAMEYEYPRNDEAVEAGADGVGSTKYTKRTTAPSKKNKYYYAINPFNKCGYGLPNCTAYAWGRFSELLGKAAKLCTSNAENWYKFKDSYERGKKPKLGAIIVWAKGEVGVDSDGAGHVAVVEEIYSDGSFLVSESGWGCSKVMWTTKIPASCMRSGYRFLGFIYNPAVTDETVTKVSKQKYVVGGTYTIQTALKVRAGAGTNYKWLKRTELTEDGKKHSLSGEYAVLKEGTKVTCLKLSGNWMKIASGWICTKSGSETYVR